MALINIIGVYPLRFPLPFFWILVFWYFFCNKQGDCRALYTHSCYFYLPFDHRSKWTWVVEFILTFGVRLRSTHCREFLLKQCRPAYSIITSPWPWLAAGWVDAIHADLNGTHVPGAVDQYAGLPGENAPVNHQTVQLRAGCASNQRKVESCR